jgi:hypothetical protein
VKSHRLLAWLALAVGGLLGVSSQLRAEALPATEYEIKAAFLYNFAKFVDWPSAVFRSNDDPFVIGLLGHDPFGPAIDEVLSGKTVQNRKIVLKRFAGAQAATASHMLFISASEAGRWEEILGALGSKPILTVSDMPDFIEREGMIGFTMENKKMRFNINKAAAEAAHLKFSSELLKLAKFVKETAVPESR